MSTKRPPTVTRENIAKQRAPHLPLGPRGLEDGFRPEEHQELAILLAQVKRLSQNLQHVHAGPHGPRVISTERPQPLQQVLGGHQLLPAGQGQGQGQTGTPCPSLSSIKCGDGPKHLFLG